MRKRGFFAVSAFASSLDFSSMKMLLFLLLLASGCRACFRLEVEAVTEIMANAQSGDASLGAFCG